MGLHSKELDLACFELEVGADIGCVGRFREPSHSKNAPSAFEYAAEVTESIASWTAKGLVRGPLEENEVPANAKINGIMCRPKPNGSARVILNLSAPKGRSVNEGIDKKRFPATMSSTKKWVTILGRAGRGAWMVKCDWTEAYKHQHVRIEDVDLQYFAWLGRFFVELMLVFGAVSSAGIYDRVAKLVLEIAARRSRFPKKSICQVLDDVCAAIGAGQLQVLLDFLDAYKAVAREVGVILASEDDPDKAFAPCQRGVVLGIEYDTVKWTWKIPQEKGARFVLQLRDLIAKDAVRQDEIWRVVGRAIHYAPLIPSGRLNLDYLMRANKVSDDANHLVRITPELRRQCEFWILMIKLCSGTTGIPNLDRGFPAWTVEVFTDAAGGSLNGIGRGCGGVAGSWWFYLSWARKINCGVKAADGKKLSKKLSALELVGPLVAVCSARLFGSRCPIRIWVDNAGSVKIWEKGYSSSCELCTTLVKAIGTVAAHFACRVTLTKIRRCSNKQAILADMLSKAEFRAFRALSGSDMDLEPGWVPRSVLAWVARPCKDDDLGGRILREIALRDAAAP